MATLKLTYSLVDTLTLSYPQQIAQVIFNF